MCGQLIHVLSCVGSRNGPIFCTVIHVLSCVTLCIWQYVQVLFEQAAVVLSSHSVLHWQTTSMEPQNMHQGVLYIIIHCSPACGFAVCRVSTCWVKCEFPAVMLLCWGTHHSYFFLCVQAIQLKASLSKTQHLPESPTARHACDEDQSPYPQRWFDW